MITCVLCGADHGQQRMYCGKCGYAMGIRCASCGAANPQADHFCGDCGHELSTTPLPENRPREAGKAQTVYSDLMEDVRKDRQTYTHLGPTLDQESINDIFHSDEVTS